MSHTPGPWECRDSVGTGLEIFAPVQLVDTVEWPRKPPDEPVMTFQLTEPAGHKLIACERWVQFEPKGWAEMQKANGNLIAAAPDLLAACEAYLNAMEKYGHPDKTDRLMRKAIEKARGSNDKRPKITDEPVSDIRKQ